MILRIIDDKFRAVIPKNERRAYKLRQGDMVEVEIKRIIKPQGAPNEPQQHTSTPASQENTA